MNWIEFLKGLIPGSKHPTNPDQVERLLRLERNERRVEGLELRRTRIENTNHLGKAIRDALEGRG